MNSADLLNLPKGHKFSASGGILTLLGFLLPWIGISVGALGMNQTERISGFQAIGNVSLLVILVLLAGAASLFITYQYLQKKYLTVLDGYGNIALGAISILVLLIAYLRVDIGVAGDLGGLFGVDISKSPEIGLIITFFGTVLMIVGGYFNMKESTQGMNSVVVPPRPQM